MTASSRWATSKHGAAPVFIRHTVRARRVRSDPVANRARGFDVAWMIRHVLEERGDTLMAGAPWLPDEWLDQAGIRGIVRQLARNNGDHLLGYGHPAGYLPLRQQLQLKLSELGISARTRSRLDPRHQPGARPRSSAISSGPATPCWSTTPATTMYSDICDCTGPELLGVRATPTAPTSPRSRTRPDIGPNVLHANGDAEPDRHRHEPCT